MMTKENRMTAYANLTEDQKKWYTQYIDDVPDLPQSEIPLAAILYALSKGNEPFQELDDDWIDDIQNTLRETGSPTPWGDGSPDFAMMARAVHFGIQDELIKKIEKAIEYGFDQTNDVDGPNYEYMAQVVHKRFLKEQATDAIAAMLQAALSAVQLVVQQIEPAKLRLLASALDKWDYKRGMVGQTEVQDELRRWADGIAAVLDLLQEVPR